MLRNAMGIIGGHTPQSSLMSHEFLEKLIRQISHIIVISRRCTKQLVFTAFPRFSYTAVAPQPSGRRICQGTWRSESPYRSQDQTEIMERRHQSVPKSLQCGKPDAINYVTFSHGL